MPKRTRQYKKNKPSRKYRRSIRRKRGGNCGCNQNSTLAQMFKGGSVLVGPSHGFTQLAGQHYQPLNTYNHDPNYSVIAEGQTQNFIHGGKRRTQHNKKLRGGSAGTIMGAAVNGLNTAVSATVVGSTNYGGIMPSNFFSQPYDRYTNLNTPIA